MDNEEIERKRGGEDLGRIICDTNTSAMREVESTGSVFAEAELEQSAEFDGETAELSKFRGDRSVDTDTLDLPEEVEITSLSAEHHSGFYTSEELESLTSKEHRLKEEELEALNRVEEALEDPDYPNNRTDLWSQLWNEERGRTTDYDSKQEAKRAFAESQDRDWITPENPKDKQISDLSGEEFASLIKKATSGEPTEEELSQAEEPEEEEVEEETQIPEVSKELANKASSAWEGRGVFEEFAQDLEASANQEVPNTFVESVPGGKRRIKTSFPKLVSELQSREDSEVIRKEGDILVAEMPEKEEY